MYLKGILLFVFLFEFASASVASDSFTEELLLKPLYANKLYSHFQFVTKWNVDSSVSNENLFQTHLFPRALSEIIARHNIFELHLSLTAGLWRYESWGYPVKDAAPGAEMWAWFKSDTADVDKNWKELSKSLSGLLCASLNFVDDTNSISPQVSFRPRGVINGPVNSSFVRFASLPREIVCTENLTPWKKLLPCDSKLGLATLLNAGYIHTTQYHSVGLQLRTICADSECKKSALELQQNVGLVYDYTLLKGRNWSLRKLFGQGILNHCPLADSSTIYVDVSSSVDVPFDLDPSPNEYIKSYRGGQEITYAKYDIKKSKPMSIAATYTKKGVVNVNIPPPLHAAQYKTGYGQQQGGIVVMLFNNHYAPLDVVVLQNIPWYVPIYLHTIEIKTDNFRNEPKDLKYTPGKLREKAHNLEYVLRLPPKSSTSISIDFDYVFLRWQEYPPDANHGFYIGSSIISAYLPLARNFTGIPQDGSMISDSFNASRSGYLVQIRTETLIITLPTPDFSMPYNVICLACTVVALAFGPMHNITTKRLVLKVGKVKTSLIMKIKQIVLGQKEPAPEAVPAEEK